MYFVQIDLECTAAAKEQVSVLFAEKASDVAPSDPRYRNALDHRLMTQTRCFRCWGSGIWTDFARELCGRASEVLCYDL